MKADKAKRLAARALRISDELNGMLRDIQANEPDDVSSRFRHAIGRVMWAVYYEILKPTCEEHPSVQRKVGPTPSARGFRPASPSRRSRRTRLG